MWTAEQKSRRTQMDREPYADRGLVTVSGELAGVYLDGDRRWMPVFAPGGYRWRPACGDEVLVIKAGEDRENPCVAGRKEEAGKSLKAGEVELYSAGGAKVTLRNNGTLNLEGNITINGAGLEQVVHNAVMAILGGG